MLLGRDNDCLAEARTVVVAAGIWTELLLPEVKQRGLAGMAFLWPGEKIEVPFVRPWAPFKQIVAFNREDGLWAGDGTSIVWKNWSVKHEEATWRRCTSAVGVEAEPARIFGVRPYHSMKPCYLGEVRPRLWVATGGAKNGTLAAGWCAHELVEKLK
jgi:glycine/D-amino acid oxidase-like deaminating enzyme